MCEIAIFTFNPFQENTYVLYDETKACIIIDPGCYTPAEEKRLTDFIEAKELTPVQLVLTHSHIDHVVGNKFVAERYGLEIALHKDELQGLLAVPTYGRSMGFEVQPSPAPSQFIAAGDVITFGNTTLKAYLTPGHSPASLSFYCEAGNFVIAGDVLFRDGVGRWDLPGGNFETLVHSIKTQLFPLGDEVKVFPGHGPDTTIGYERLNNPYL